MHFAASIPTLSWQPTEISENLESLQSNLEQYDGSNVKYPLELNVCDECWPDSGFNAVYTANTLHIISESLVESLFRGVGKVLEKEGMLMGVRPVPVSGEIYQ